VGGQVVRDLSERDVLRATEAAKFFYAHHGFIAAPGYPLRLYRRMKDIRASLR
jgi:hypothetical protein